MKTLPILLLAAGLALGAGPAAYAEEDHLDEAMKHASAAAEASDGKSIAKHAGLARTHAKIADEHLDAGIKSLDSAMEHGKLGHDKMAQQAAEEAKAHLKAAE
jgi:hypothetical protein